MKWYYCSNCKHLREDFICMRTGEYRAETVIANHCPMYEPKED